MTSHRTDPMGGDASGTVFYGTLSAPRSGGTLGRRRFDHVRRTPPPIERAGERVSRPRDRPETRVATVLPNRLEAPIVDIAVFKAGAVRLPVNPALSSDEIDHILTDAMPAAVVCDEARIEPSRNSSQTCRRDRRVLPSVPAIRPRVAGRERPRGRGKRDSPRRLSLAGRDRGPLLHRRHDRRAKGRPLHAGCADDESPRTPRRPRLFEYGHGTRGDADFALRWHLSAGGAARGRDGRTPPGVRQGGVPRGHRRSRRDLDLPRPDDALPTARGTTRGTTSPRSRT